VYSNIKQDAITMSNLLCKKAGPGTHEESGLSDPRTNLPIRVSITTRKNYRKYFNERWKDRRDLLYDLDNKTLNEIIAQDFAASMDEVVHMFVANTSDIQSRKREWIEIRKVRSRTAFNFFFSVIRPGSIDIITTSTRYNKPGKPRVFIPRY